MEKFGRKFLKIIYLFILFQSIFNLHAAQNLEKNLNPNSSKKAHRVVVFVHGVVWPGTSLSFPSLVCQTKKQESFRFCKYSLSRIYQKYLDQVRFDEIHKFQPIGAVGLHQIDSHGKNKKTNSLFSTLFEMSYRKCEKHKDEIFHFYTFGWDGRIDKGKRKKWAEIFYLSLLQEVEKIKKEVNLSSEDIKIDIYGHSHGGSVSLYLAAWDRKYLHKLSINRVILLGTPVQAEMAKFVKHRMFNSIYHVFSWADKEQIADQLFSGGGFSYRRFDSILKEQEIPCKLKQIEIKCGGVKPTHFELWFLAGDDSNFFLYKWVLKYFMSNKNFKLHPFPVSIFMPLIMNYLENNFRGNSTNNFSLNLF